MKKNLQKVTIINNIVCAVLLVVLVGTMFMPFWDYTAETRKDVRICRDCDYVHESKDLEDGFTCPECGAEMDDDGYCDYCGWPNNQGWIGGNY